MPFQKHVLLWLREHNIQSANWENLQKKVTKYVMRRNLTTLHGLNVERKTSGNDVNKRNKSNTHSIVVVENNQNEEICCNSTYTGS